MLTLIFYKVNYQIFETFYLELMFFVFSRFFNIMQNDVKNTEKLYFAITLLHKVFWQNLEKKNEKKSEFPVTVLIFHY